MMTAIERGQFVALFNRGGYVLDFSTTGFDTFTLQSVGVAVCSKYGLSKGRSLMAFLEEASEDDRVKLLSDLFEYYEMTYQTEYDKDAEDNGAFSPVFDSKYCNLYKKCKEIINREKNKTMPLVDAANELKQQFSSDYLSSQIDLMLDMQEKNPTEAIGKAKELIESCCKTILESSGIQYDKNWDLNKLSGQTMLQLGLMPDNIKGTNSVDIIAKALLGNLQQVALRMAELRNPYGSGHGKSASFKSLPVRYARLAVGSSITLVRFLWDTYSEKSK
ncbi:MAG: abortive infection family protein [Anaerolineaceae bacterium]|nr:abortive infection family protein [Anaerolineaceae bacterium]